MRTLARQAWPLSVAATVFALAVGLPSGDSDTWWHLASGRWMLEHREALRVDIFSSTATGEPYDLGEWLGQIVLYSVFAVASWPGLSVLRAVLVAVAGFAATRSAMRFAPAGIAVPVTAAALLLSKPIWTDRPQLFTLALFPLALELLFAARAGSRAALVAIVPLLLAWSDLHGGYALGLALLWLFAMSALREGRRAGAFLATAVVATVVVTTNPGALALSRSFGHVVGATRGIVEESPVDVATPFGMLFALFVVATFAAFLLGRGSLLGALVLVPMLWLALSAQRHIPLFGFAAVPFLAGPLWAALTWAADAGAVASGSRISRFVARAGAHLEVVARVVQFKGRQPRLSLLARDRSTPSTSPASAAGQRAALLPIALWIAALASIATIPTTPDVTAYPTAALAALRSSSGILLNEYDWGGWLIWNAPTRPVFVDGRLFPFVTDGVFDQYRAALVVLPGWRSTLDRWNVTEALLRPTRPLAQALRDDGWIVRSEGERYVLLEKPR